MDNEAEFISVRRDDLFDLLVELHEARMRGSADATPQRYAENDIKELLGWGWKFR